MNSLVSLDTMGLIWVLRSKGDKTNSSIQSDIAEYHYRGAILMDILQETHATIVLPSICVAELLVGLEPDKHAIFLASLHNSHFDCRTFDLPAAELAATLWIKHRGLPKGEQITRQVLKADTMIVATAKIAGAQIFYSNDPKCRSLAKLAGMEADDLPKKHPDVYFDIDLRKKFGLPIP